MKDETSWNYASIGWNVLLIIKTTVSFLGIILRCCLAILLLFLELPSFQLLKRIISSSCRRLRLCIVNMAVVICQKVCSIIPTNQCSNDPMFRQIFHLTNTNSIWSTLIPNQIYQFQFHFTDSFYPLLFTMSRYSEYLPRVPTWNTYSGSSLYSK